MDETKNYGSEVEKQLWKSKGINLFRKRNDPNVESTEDKVKCLLSGTTSEGRRENFMGGGQDPEKE